MISKLKNTSIGHVYGLKTWVVMASTVLIFPVGALSDTGAGNGELPTESIQEVRVLDHTSFGGFTLKGTSLSQWERDKNKESWVHTNRPLVELRVDGEATRLFAVSLNGKTLVSMSGTSVGVWDLDKLKLITSRSLKGRPTALEVSRNGALMAVGYPSGNIFVYQVADGRKVSTLRGGKGLTSMTISPDGTKIASADSENIVRVWDTQTGREVSASEELNSINALAFSHDGKMLASAGRSLIDDQNTIQVWGGSEFFLLASLAGHDEAVHSLAFSKDDGTLYSASQDNKVRRWDVKIGHAVLEITAHKDDVVKVLTSANHDWVFTASLDGVINVWETNNKKSVKQIKSIKVPSLKTDSLVFIPEKNWLAGIADVNKGISIWSASSYSYHPWRDIRKVVEHEFLNKRYSPKEGVPLVETPKLPSLANFQKDPFESQATYVERLTARYRAQVNQMLSQYRSQINQRNQQVTVLREQLSHKTSLQAVEQRILAIEAIKQFLGNALVYPLELNNNPGYDPEREVMGVRVGFNRAYYFETLEVPVKEGQPARELYEALQSGKVTADVDFEFVNVSRVRIAKVYLRYGGKTFVGRAKLSKGFKVISDSIRNIRKPNNPYAFQRYKIPYTNFEEFLSRELRKSAVK